MSVLGLGATVLVVLALAGRLPEGIARRLPFVDRGGEEALVPPPLPENAELADDLVGPPSAEPGRTNVGRGVLSIPKTFTATGDGSFDLVIHFHGNTELALASYEVALLDAVVLVVNLGNGSGVYEDHYANPESLERVFERVPKIVQARGLENARIRHVALVGWSAGYGAIIKALGHRPHFDRVDAIVLLDGLHTSYLPGTDQVDGAPITNVERFMEQAKRGEKLAVLTHSNIRPSGYLGVRETADFLLGRLGVERHEASAQTTLPQFRAAVGVLPRDELRALELRSEARMGSLVVRGFGGDSAAHHISHLLQMSEIALPELAKWWAPKPKL
jgi:hypothetical protein